ncbi:MAG: hypothetical protein AB7O49_10150 [Sphingomonadales bacterium]
MSMFGDRVSDKTLSDLVTGQPSAPPAAPSKLDEFRARNPAYRDVPDKELAEGLYRNVYAKTGMTQADFYARIGMAAEAPREATGGSIARQIAPGVWRGLGTVKDAALEAPLRVADMFTNAPRAIINKGLELAGIEREIPLADTPAAWRDLTAPLERTAVGRAVNQADQTVGEYLGGAPEPANSGERVAAYASELVGTALPFAAAPYVGAGRALTAPPPQNVLQALWQSMQRSAATRPGQVAATEAISTVGSGVGGGMAVEQWPDNKAAELAGQLVGGGLPAVVAVSPLAQGGGLAVKGYRKGKEYISQDARTARAKQKVGEAIGDMSTLEPGITRSQAVEQAINEAGGGLNLSLAERTGSPSLLTAQTDMESRLTGGALDEEIARRQANEAAISAYARQAGPTSPADPDYVMAAAGDRGAAVRDRIERAIAEAARRRAAVAEGIPEADLPQTGANMREALNETRKQVRREFENRAAAEGLNDVDLSLDFSNFQNRVREAYKPKTFDNPAYRPKVLDDILSYSGFSGSLRPGVSPTSRNPLSDQLPGPRSVMTAKGGTVRVSEPLDLVSWLRTQGGLQESAGELRTMGLNNTTRGSGGKVDKDRFLGPIVSKEGLRLDDAALRAWEEGYFVDPERPTIDDFLTAVNDTFNGRARLYKPEDMDELALRDSIEQLYRDAEAAGINTRGKTERELMDAVERATGKKMRQPVTFQDIRNLRERIVDDLAVAQKGSPVDRARAPTLSRLLRDFDSFIVDAELRNADPGLAERWRGFRKDYREKYVLPFREPNVRAFGAKDNEGFLKSTPEDIATDLWKPGNVSGVRAYTKALQTLDPASPEYIQGMEALEATALDSLRKATVRNFVVEPRLLEAWRRQYGSLVDESPYLKGMVDNIQAANDAVLTRQAQLEGRRKAVERSVMEKRLAAVEIGARSPESVIDEAVRNPGIARRLVGRLRNDKDAMAGLRQAVWDRVPLDDPAATVKFLSDNRQSLSAILSEQHLADIQLIAEARAMVNRVPAPSGQPFDASPFAAFEGALGSTLPSLAASWRAVERGRSSAFYEVPARGLQWLRAKANEQGDRVWREALYDPEVARDIVRSQSNPANKAMRERLRRRLWHIGLSIDPEAPNARLPAGVIQSQDREERPVRDMAPNMEPAYAR